MTTTMDFPAIAVDYPESDGQPMAESDFQRIPLIYAIEALKYHFGSPAAGDGEQGPRRLSLENPSNRRQFGSEDQPFKGDHKWFILKGYFILSDDATKSEGGLIRCSANRFSVLSKPVS